MVGLEKERWGVGGEEAFGGQYNVVKHSFVHILIPPCVRVHLTARKGTIGVWGLCFLRGGTIKESLAGSLSNFVGKFQRWPQV